MTLIPVCSAASMPRKHLLGWLAGEDGQYDQSQTTAVNGAQLWTIPFPCLHLAEGHRARGEGEQGSSLVGYTSGNALLLDLL